MSGEEVWKRHGDMKAMKMRAKLSIKRGMLTLTEILFVLTESNQSTDKPDTWS